MPEREELAAEFNRVSVELEKAAAHCKATSDHFREHNVPSACAHIFACLGHMHNAQKGIDKCAATHSEFAQLR